MRIGTQQQHLAYRRILLSHAVVSVTNLISVTPKVVTIIVLNLKQFY